MKIHGDLSFNNIVELTEKADGWREFSWCYIGSFSGEPSLKLTVAKHQGCNAGAHDARGSGGYNVRLEYKAGTLAFFRDVLEKDGDKMYGIAEAWVKRDIEERYQREIGQKGLEAVSNVLKD